MTSSHKSISDSTSPGQNHSFPFSISAILSDEVGQKKSPPTSCSSNHFNIDSIKGSMYSTSSGHTSETPKRPRKSSYSFSSSRTPKMPQQPNYQALGSNKVYESLRGGQHAASYYTPNKHPSTSQMNSNHISPFNPNLLVALGHHPSPNREDQDELFNETSLDMLSEVARYHSELSDADANSTTESTMRERLSNIKLLSTSEDVEASTSDARNASLHVRSRKTATPSILKRDKRRRRVSSGGSCMNSSGDEESSSSLRFAQSHLNAGFLSPLSSEKFASNKELGFSPSIFLSRPENSHGDSMPEVSSHSPTSSAPIPIPKPDSGSNHDRTDSRHAQCPRPWSSSPGYESDGTQSNTTSEHHNNSLNRSRDDFVTSTPIKVDKENLRRGSNGSAAEQEGVAWSPTVQLGSGRKHLREANDYPSSSDGEAIKKPRLPTPTPKPPQQLQQQSSKKSKARTKLSPLLENSYSPIFKEGHLPSPLTTALATTPTRGMSFGMIAPPTAASILPQQVPAAQGVLGTLPSSLSTNTISQPPRSFLPAPQTSRPTSLFGATTIGRGGGATMLGPQTILNVSSPNHGLPYGAFQSVAGLLNKDRLQLPQPAAAQQPHTSHHHPMLNSISLSQLHSNSLAFNPLANAQGVRAYSSSSGNTGVFTPANIVHPNYVPLMVNTPTQPLPAPNCLYAPYTSNPVVQVEKSAEKMRLGSTSDKIHSVPPRFIFANNRSEKRSRLTEAINKSLSETPSQPSKLPEEWTKLACGQTRDQKMLTEKARMFLNFRPRQLTFSSDAD